MNSQSPTTSANRPLAAIILAAGQSKRMKSDLVKVLHDVAQRPMLAWVIDACRGAGCDSITIVVGHQADRIQNRFSREPGLSFVHQHERLGTGHAVQQAADQFEGFPGDVLVLAGDGPLIRAATLTSIVEHHRAQNAAVTLATAHIVDPTGYGRILRDGNGRFERIVEHKDATPEQRSITEVNPSYYCFDSISLFDALASITNDNASGEYYLTDVCEVLRAAGRTVEIADVVNPDEIHSINDAAQLKHVETILASRLSQGAVQ